MAYAINISDAELQKSAVTYRKELLVMPVIAAEATLQHMTPRPGVKSSANSRAVSNSVLTTLNATTTTAWTSSRARSKPTLAP